MRRTQNNPSKANLPNQEANRAIAVNEFIQQWVDEHKPAFQERNIKIKTELASLTAEVDASLIRTAFAALMSYSFQSLNQGGELTIALIDCQYHWELEVANQAVRFPSSQEELDLMFSNEVQANPNVLPFPPSDHLRNAYRAALAHGGQLQMWDCPQGGTAHVLVIPKRTNPVPGNYKRVDNDC